MLKSLKKMNKFYKSILIIQFIVLMLILSPITSFIPVTSVILILYLLFIPGVLILNIINLKEITNLEAFLFILGISCSVLMFIGLFMNTMLPLIGLNKPLSYINLVISIFIITSLLYIIGLIKNPEFKLFKEIDNSIFVSKYSFFIYLFPLISIIGAYLIQFWNINILGLLLIILITTTPLLVYLNKIPEKYNSLLIWSVSISMLLLNVLSSIYIQGSDLHVEYYLSNLVSVNSAWDPYISHTHNTVISDVILAPILSIFSKVPLAWIFKLIDTFLFSLVPVILYYIFKKQTNSDIAFYSCFFIIAGIIFYTEMLQLAKQMMAEFFLAIIMLTLFSKTKESIGKSFLLISFIFSLTLSHYGLTYIIIISLLFTYISNLILDRKNIILTRKFSLTLILAFTVFTLTWYIYTGSSSVFSNVVNLGYHTISSINDVFSPVAQGGVYWLVRKLSFTEEILRYLYVIVAFFISVGLLSVLYKKFKQKSIFNFDDTFLLLSISFMLWLISGIIIPKLVSVGSIGFTRVFHISTMFLAPFAIIGLMEAEQKIIQGIKSLHQRVSSNKKPYKIVVVFLMLYFLFNSSFIGEVIQETVGGDHAVSPSISQPRIKYMGDPTEKITLFSFNYPKQDIISAEWLSSNKNNRTIILDSGATARVFYSYGNISPINRNMKLIIPGKTDFNRDYYVFLRSLNYKMNIMRLDFWISKKYDYYNTSEILPEINAKKDLIYNNGGSVIYY